MTKKQVPIRIDEATLTRFERELSTLRPPTTRNAMIVHLIEEWTKEQVKKDLIHE